MPELAPSLVIQLTPNPDGTAGVVVQGPIQNKMLCFGMLEMAKKAIHDFTPPRIAVPNDMVLPTAEVPS